MTRPLILVTNDDGYQADGIQALKRAMDEVGEAWMVAPDSERSAASHSLTLTVPLRASEVGERCFAINGTPTDSVAVALGSLLPRRPDIVVSGVNHGWNMGDDVHYSGTVSAAFEGVILGVPSIAFSQEMSSGAEYDRAGRFAARLVRWVLDNPLPERKLLNVNFPAGEARGVALTRLGLRTYPDGIVERVDPRGRPIFWIGGGAPVYEEIPGTDFEAVGRGLISVTPLQLDMTCNGLLESLRDGGASWLDEA